MDFDKEKSAKLGALKNKMDEAADKTKKTVGGAFDETKDKIVEKTPEAVKAKTAAMLERAESIKGTLQDEVQEAFDKAGDKLDELADKGEDTLKNIKGKFGG